MNSVVKLPRAEFRDFVVYESWWPHKLSAWSKESAKAFQAFGGGVKAAVSEIESAGKAHMQRTSCVPAGFPCAVWRWL